MTIRIQVQADGAIEIMRPERKAGRYLYYRDLARAQRVVCYLLREEQRQAMRERFVPQATKEARAAYKELEEQANEQHKAAGPTRR